jgi:hypothetical protein
MNLPHYLGLLHRAQTALAAAFRAVGEAHAEEADVFHLTRTLAQRCDRHAERLAPFLERYGRQPGDEPARFAGPRSGGLGLLRDLHDLYVLAAQVDIAWTMVGQAARGLRDDELLGAASAGEAETATQMRWLRTRMKTAAPQALVVA